MIGAKTRHVAIALVAATVSVTWTATGAAEARPRPNGDVVRVWTTVAFNTIRQTSGSDALAARLYAMVNVAMFDAVNGLAKRPAPPALVAPERGAKGDPVAAAATAAHHVLVALYPSHRDTYDAQLDADVASMRGDVAHGQAWGARVAAAVVAARADDGAAGSEMVPARSGIGQFRSPWDAHFRHLRPFALADPAPYAEAPLPAMDSPAYTSAFNDVKAVGSKAPDPAAAATYGFWKLSGGTNQPPGAWLQIAQTVSAVQGLSLEETAQLFALESMALADTVGPTNEAKFDYGYWRPETAINEGDDDGNSDTDGEPWTGRDKVAGTPEHFSGHSSFSGAGAEVLAQFFCRDDISFTITSDSGGGADRSYASFSAAAAEVGRSRVLGGQHFEFSNQAGLTAGRRIADEVVARLRPAGCPS